ncbi:tRNA guanosine(34) transglycosylase Tgt [Candidatus Berkelbacteria bacterium]|nr:tRNA guanosine(34) transglycosylase Tgt [Candidatus Berkelbacteria bacterium]
MSFKIIAQRGQARVGELATAHGVVKTPAYLPCATHGALRGLAPNQLESLELDLILANAYHLYLKPGIDLIEQAGGLHKFMGWKRAILTDSGGFQAFALPKFVKFSEQGIKFRSHHDGSLHEFTPELVVDIQERLGVDLATCLDVCTGFPVPEEKVEAAVDQTNRWAERSISSWTKKEMKLYGMVQGSIYLAQRQKSAEFLTQLPFEGFAIGGNMYTFGQTVKDLNKEKPKMWEVVSFTTKLLPKNKPRHLLGVGEPQDIIAGVEAGVDTFDCVMASRIARHGSVWLEADGQYPRISLANSQYKNDFKPLDPNCSCPTCLTGVARSYLHHLVKIGDPAAGAILTIHNVWTLEELTRKIRSEIVKRDENE